jgi:hypothetical protein
MWGLSIYLMQLADYIHGRKNKMDCKLCGRSFKDKRELDLHTESAHK